MARFQLHLIDSLLQEFYHQTTPTGRKREIETELIAFKEKSDSWQICLKETVSLESNQFLWFFCASTVSHAITRRWSQFSSNDRTILRETLWKTYANLPLNGQMRRQRDTIAQLIAFIGKREFPDQDNYISHCIELIKSKFPLGVNLLRITSEEVVSNREDVTTERKNYFHSCVSVYTPEIMDLMTMYLLIAVCHINNKDTHSIPNVVIDYSITASLPNDNQFSSSLLELLYCVQHLVSWINTDLISDYFLMSILDLSQYRDQAEHALVGLSVLNEILYLQKPLPSAMTLMKGVNGLLEHYTVTKPQNEMYIDKFRELLRLYAIKYWPKLLYDDGELLKEFIVSLYHCTICKNGALDFTEKLEIWTPILKGLVLNDKLNRYIDYIYLLVNLIIQRIQFEYNKAELELLDNESVEDNMQTEWQHFLTQCIECVSLVAEARPWAVFMIISRNWTRLHEYLVSFEHDIDCGKSIELVRKMKSSNCSEHLRDFSTICQALARIAPFLDVNSISQTNSTNINGQLELLSESLMDILKFFTRNKITQLKFDKTTFQADYDYLFAQILMAIRSIIPLSTFLRNEQTIQVLLSELGGILLPNTSYNPIVHMAASQLFLCIATVLRPKYLLETPVILSLMQTGPSLTYLPPQAITNIYISLVSYLVLPWRNVESGDHHQDYPHRCAVLREYIGCLAKNVLELDIDKDAKVSSTLLTQISNFDVLLKFFKDSSNTSKDMLALAFKPIITKVLMMYNCYGLSNNHVADSVAAFSLSVLYTLSAQLGSQFIKEMISLFINVSAREQLSVANFSALEKIMQMFQAIVEQPGNASLSMLPTILDFVLQHILPLVQQDNNAVNSCDIVSTLYSLFDSILTCKWQYFYKSNIQNSGSLLTPSGGENLHAGHFIAILNAYGQMLVSGSDPNIVRQVLQSMQNVNERWRLYQRPLFKDNLLASFQVALINMLLSGEGALHFEVLSNALFAMGQVDTLKLRESFMTTGFSINMKIVDEICLSTDIPTFSQKLTQLIQDTHVHMAQLQS